MSKPAIVICHGILSGMAWLVGFLLVFLFGCLMGWAGVSNGVSWGMLVVSAIALLVGGVGVRASLRYVMDRSPKLLLREDGMEVRDLLDEPETFAWSRLFEPQLDLDHNDKRCLLRFKCAEGGESYQKVYFSLSGLGYSAQRIFKMILQHVEGASRRPAVADSAVPPASMRIAIPEMHFAALEDNLWERQPGVFGYDGQVLMTATVAGKLMGLAVPRGAAVRMPQLGSSGTPLAFSPDGSLLALGAGGSGGIWSVIDGTKRSTLFGVGSKVFSSAFSQSSRLLATCDYGRSAQLWDVNSGKQLFERSKEIEDPIAVAFHPNETILATGNMKGQVHLWSVPTGELLNTFSAHRQQTRALAFSPDGQLLATGSFETTVRLWRIPSGEPIADLPRHGGSIQSLAFHPTGSLLAVAHTDQAIRVWKVPEAESVKTVEYDQPTLFMCVCFSPEGKTLAVAGGGGVKFWRLDLQHR